MGFALCVVWLSVGGRDASVMTGVNLHCELEFSGSYKLIQLTPDLLKVLKDSDNDNGGADTNTGAISTARGSCNTGLQFKSINDAKGEVMLCSRDKTWLLRQKNHSNTVMLMREFVPSEDIVVPEDSLFGLAGQPQQNLCGFSKTTYEYETKLVKGRLIVDDIPIYDGETDFKVQLENNHNKANSNSSKHKLMKSIDDLLERSPCSQRECLEQWHSMGGSVIDGHLCLLSEKFLSRALNIVLVSVMGESLDLQELSLEAVYRSVVKDIEEDYNVYTEEVVRSVLNKFGESNNKENNNSNSNSSSSTWALNMPVISKWYGLQALRKYATKSSMAVDEFLIKWKSMFPPFFSCDIDIATLRGALYRPQENTIQYVSKSVMPQEPRDRFKTLFKLQSVWELDDLAPFVEDLNTRGLKLDTFVMKHARRKRVARRGGKPTTLVMPR